MSITIEGTKSNDTLTNEEANATVDAGVGNDHIINSGDGAILIGGFGNDVIENSGADVILDGGLGSDRLELDGINQTIRYANGDGNDMVIGWTENDVLHLTDGSKYTLTTNGDDAFVKVGLGTITFKDARDIEITIDRTPLNGGSGRIKNPDAAVEGGEGNDTLLGTDAADVFVYTVGAGNDVTGDYDDEKTLYQAQDAIVIVGETSLSEATIKDSGNTTTLIFDGGKKSRLTINKDAATTPISFYFGADSETALETDPAIYGELPEGVHYAGTNCTRLIVDDTLEGELIEATIINSQLTTIDASNAAGYVEIYGNAKNNVLKGGAEGALLNGGAGNDKLYGTTDATAIDTFVFEMQPDGKKDVVFNYDSGDMIVVDTSLLESSLPIFEEGLITYEGAKANFNGFNDSKADAVLTLNKKNVLTLKNASGKAINIYDENFELIATYGHFLPDGLKYNEDKTAIEVEDAEIANSNSDIAIDLNDTLELYATAVDVNLTGVTADINLYGNSKDNSLKSGDGYSLMLGGAGNDTLEGSTMADSNVDFYYVSGNDVIGNYDADKDLIYIDAGTSIDSAVLMSVTAANFSEQNGDVVLEIDDLNSLTIKNASGKTVEIYDESGALNGGSGQLKYSCELPSGLQYNEDRTAIEVANAEAVLDNGDVQVNLSSEEEDYSYAASVEKVDLSPISADEFFSATLIGNANANELYAADGGANTLYGGDSTAADTLYGGSGSDTFIYAPRGGKDKIVDYGAEDAIVLGDDEEIESIAIADKKNAVSVTLNGDKTSVLAIAKRNINTPITFRGSVATINGRESQGEQDGETFMYGANSELMTLSNNGATLSIASDDDVYAYANEINSQIKSIDARQSNAYVNLVGNANANALYAGSGGSSLDGGYNAIKSKATNDQLIGGSGDDVFVYNFDGGLGGKDVITNYGAGDDVISLDVAPKSVTTNGKNVVLNFEERVNGKKKTGTLTINGAGKITSDTTIAIEIAGDYGEYRFANKLKKAAWSSEDYWFAQSDSASDELTQLSAVEDALVMPLDFDAFRQSTNALELPSCSARKRLKT